MNKHPKAGQPVKIANGPWAGKYYVVHDWYVNQYQGKKIENLKETRGAELLPVTKRGYPIDSKLVWGRLHPTMEWKVVHDDELVVKMNVIQGDNEKVELPPNVEPMSKKRKPKVVKKEKTDDPGTAS